MYILNTKWPWNSKNNLLMTNVSFCEFSLWFWDYEISRVQHRISFLEICFWKGPRERHWISSPVREPFILNQNSFLTGSSGFASIMTNRFMNNILIFIKISTNFVFAYSDYPYKGCSMSVLQITLEMHFCSHV